MGKKNYILKLKKKIIQEYEAIEDYLSSLIFFYLIPELYQVTRRLSDDCLLLKDYILQNYVFI